MITTETPPPGGTPRGVPGQRSHKRAKIVVPAFLLATVFIFIGAPTATAATVFANSMRAFGDPPPCRGDKPGVCPYYLDPGRQTLDRPNTGRPGEQSTPLESLTP